MLIFNFNDSSLENGVKRIFGPNKTDKNLGSYIYESMKVIMIDKNNIHVFATFKVVLLDLKNFNNNQKLIIISFSLKLRLTNMLLTLEFT